MSLPSLGTLTSLPAVDHPELLGAPVAAALADWPPAAELAVAEIDPELADTAACAAAYDLPLDAGANCVLVAGRRAGEERIAACMIRTDGRADINNVVKRLLDVRKASFLSMDRAVAESGMEYGGITPIGLPADWPILIDTSVADTDWLVIGSGIRSSKLATSGPDLARLPGAEVLDLAAPLASN